MELDLHIELDEFLVGKLKSTEGEDLAPLAQRLLKEHGVKLMRGQTGVRGRPAIPRAQKLEKVTKELHKAYAELREEAAEYISILPWPWQLEDQEKKIEEMILNEDLTWLTRFYYRKPWKAHTWVWRDFYRKYGKQKGFKNKFVEDATN